jgi:methyl-accepting chemotaxis protein
MKSMQGKLVLIMMLLGVLAAAIAGVTVLWQYSGYVNGTVDATLRHAARAASLVVDVSHWRDLYGPGMDTSDYQIGTLTRLQVVADEFNLAYAYVLVKDEQGKMIFIFDSGNLDGEDDSTFLQEYEDAPEELARAFDTGDLVICAEPYTDEWGTFRSAFLPILDEQRSVIAVAGVDLNIGFLNALNRRTFLSCAAALLAALVVIVTFAVVVAGRLAKPLRKLAGAANVVAGGDLRQTIRVANRDEIGQLAVSFNNMSDRLGAIISQIRDASGLVAGSSGQLAETARQLAEGAQSQASTLEETSAAVEELSASVEQVAEHAQSQAASVERSSGNMQQVQRTAQQVSRTLQAVSSASQQSMERAQSGAEAVTRAVEAIRAISSNAERIAGIVNVIQDIASQTNLLALNAAIEAARAGEHGRGFAVVADEVSKLAERSSASTKEIESLIRESTSNVTSGVETAQGALGAMDGIIAGARVTSETVAALGLELEQSLNALAETGKATDTISEMSRSISAATAEQSMNARQVAKSIEHINELTQSAASAAEQMSAATSEMTGLAGNLQKLVEQFQLAEAGRSAHLTVGTLELAAPA